jgi:glutamate 5-kinase
MCAKVEGFFLAGDAVSIMEADGTEIARAIVEVNVQGLCMIL